MRFSSRVWRGLPPSGRLHSLGSSQYSWTSTRQPWRSISRAHAPPSGRALAGCSSSMPWVELSMPWRTQPSVLNTIWCSSKIAAKALAPSANGMHVGTAGLAASFSFYFSHHVSTIEGGMVITNDSGLADELRGRRAHGWVRDRSDRETWVSRYPDLDPRFLFATVGYNVRPTEINAAIGSVQLRRLDEMLVARESLARTVNDWLAASAPWLELIGARALAGVATTDRRDAR